MATRFRSLVLAASVVAGGALVACGDDESATPAPEVELSAAAAEGEAVAQDNGCVACHSTDGGTSTGPTWAGLAGSEVELESGETVTADRDYLERAITDPRADLHAGYAPIMPSYDLSDDELDALIAYIEELGTAGAP